MSSKSLAVFFLGSLAVHAFIVASFYSPFSNQTKDVDRSVTISYIEPLAKPVSVQKIAAPQVKEKVEAIVAASPIHSMEKVAPRQERKTVRSLAHLPREISPRTASVPRSEDLLADPKKGRVFSGYFGRIKEKIQQTVQKKYSRQNIGEGNVSLLFILNSRGGLENVSVIDKQSHAGPEVKNFAIECVRESVPFAAFPKELSLDEISFNVTLLFEEI